MPLPPARPPPAGPRRPGRHGGSLAATNQCLRVSRGDGGVIPEEHWALMNGSRRLSALMRGLPPLMANTPELAAPLETHTRAPTKCAGTCVGVRPVPPRGRGRCRGRGRGMAWDLRGNTYCVIQTPHLLRKLLFLVFPRVGAPGQLSQRAAEGVGDAAGETEPEAGGGDEGLPLMGHHPAHSLRKCPSPAFPASVPSPPRPKSSSDLRTWEGTLNTRTSLGAPTPQGLPLGLTGPPTGAHLPGMKP